MSAAGLDLDRFRERLRDERRRAASALEFLRQENPGSLEEETEEQPIDNHPAEMATPTLDREIDYSLEESETRALRAIDAALQRIDDGTYGSCERCGRAIGKDRLEAIPWTTLCIEDARKDERA